MCADRRAVLTELWQILTFLHSQEMKRKSLCQLGGLRLTGIPASHHDIVNIESNNPLHSAFNTIEHVCATHWAELYNCCVAS